MRVARTTIGVRVGGLLDWSILVIVPSGPATNKVGAPRGGAESVMVTIPMNWFWKFGKHAR